VVHIIDRQTGRWVYYSLRISSAIDIRPVITVTAAAVPRRRGNALVTGATADAVIDCRVMVIGLRISHPCCRGMTRLTAFNHRQAGVTLGTVAGNKCRGAVVSGYGINRPAARSMAGLAVSYYRQVSMTFLTVCRRSDCLMVEGRSLTGVTRLAIIVLARQATSMTIGTGQTVTFYAHNIVMLRFGRTYTAGSRPESIVVAGRTGLWHEGVVTIDTISDRACTEDHVMMLAYRRVATGSSPEARIMTELTAVHSRNVCRRTVTETAGDV
jgi:hypothetical protein